MSRHAPAIHKTRHWPSYDEVRKRRDLQTIWLAPGVSRDAAPTGKRGRHQTCSDAAVQTCLSMTVVFGMALRQTTGFVEGLLHLIVRPRTVPDFSTLPRRQKTPAVNIPHRGSKGPLHLLIDSTGIKVGGEGEWQARKHGGPGDRPGARSTSEFDEETLAVRAVEITGSHIGDAPVKPWKTVTAGAVARNEALRASKDLGRALWRRWNWGKRNHQPISTTGSDEPITRLTKLRLCATLEKESPT